MAIIYLRGLPNDFPVAGIGRAALEAVLHGLAPCGVCPARTVTGAPVGSYPAFAPLSAFADGIFSVTLSVAVNLIAAPVLAG